MDDLKPVYPDDENWKTYVRLCENYLKETWPHVALQNYEKQLRERVAEGGRHLFLLIKENTFVGIANVYTVNKTLHIAEFGIKPSYRNRGIGRHFVNLICKIANEQGMTTVSAEVDKDLVSSKRFWGKLGFSCVKGHSRDIYKINIASP